jgi:thiol:disulfide interchange protein
MRKNIVKTLGIFTLALFVLSITGATAFSGSTNYNKTQENFTNSKVSLTENTVVEVTQIEQINSALKKGPVLLKIGAEWCHVGP